MPTRTLIYSGPPHAEHPDLGPLVAGQPYQVDAALAEYWLAHDPDTWRDPAALDAPADATASGTDED